MMLSRRLLRSYTRATTITSSLIFGRSYNNRNTSFYQSQGNNNKQYRGKQEQQEEDRFLRNLNFRDGGGPSASSAHGHGNAPDRRRRHRHQRRDNDSEIPVHRGTVASVDDDDQQVQLPDDFDQLFPDDHSARSGNGKVSGNRWPRGQERLADGEFKENRSRFFEKDLRQQPASLRDMPSDNNQADSGDPIADTLLHDLYMTDKERVREAGRVRQRTLDDSSAECLAPSVPEDADEIFKKMKETGLIPNAVAMLDGLCKDGLVQEAMKLFSLMREKGTIPEVVIYTAVVEGFCKAAKYDDAKRIFKKMHNNGIVPNSFSYAVLVKGLCAGGNLEDAVEYCIEMLESGHLPNAATLVGLVDGFCKEKGAEQAVEIVKRLHEKGFVLDDKAVRDHLEKKGPFSPEVWEAIFGKKKPRKPF